MENLIKSNITIISGGFGSGKTNIAVNLAEYMAVRGHDVSVVDLDMVNPYFRSADNAKELQDLGVKTLAPIFANTNVETPSMPVAYYSIFTPGSHGIVDVGGDPDGAIILAVDEERYKSAGYYMIFVFNLYRPMTSDAPKALTLLRQIEEVSRLKFSGIINNSNLGVETTKALLEKSFPVAEELSELSGLPILATTAIDTFCIPGVTKIQNKTKALF